MILINSSSRDALKIFQPFLPIFVPVGIGYLIAAAEREGIKAHFIDEQIEDDTPGLVVEYVRAMKRPYIFGFSVLTAAFKSAIDTSRKLKDLYPDSIIVFGGIHPTALPDAVLTYPHIDFVLRGEGEKSLIELYKCIKEGKSVAHIENLSYRLGDEIIHNPRQYILDALDTYPTFPYHLFNPQKYDLAFVIGSRGCPYNCIFCSNRITNGKKYRYRAAEDITNELDMLYSRYNKKFVLFLDDNFLVNKERVYILIKEIKKRGLDKKMTFSFQARGDNVDPVLLKDLHGAGFRSIFFGIETSSNSIMETIKKGETVEQVIEGVKMAKEIGFHVSATFVYALPGETYEDRMNCVKMNKDLNLDMVRYNNATPYPGTELSAMAISENKLYVQGLYENFNSVSTFIENPFRKIPFSYVPAGNSENEIRRDLLYSYFAFYLNIKRLRSVLTKPEQGAGWFSAGENTYEIIRKLPAIAALGLMLSFKFGQLLYLMTIKKETRLPVKNFVKIFQGNFV